MFPFSIFISLFSNRSSSRNVARMLPEFAEFAKIQNPAVTTDKLQPTPDHMPHATLLAFLTLLSLGSGADHSLVCATLPQPGARTWRRKFSFSCVHLKISALTTASQGSRGSFSADCRHRTHLVLKNLHGSNFKRLKTTCLQVACYLLTRLQQN